MKQITMHRVMIILLVFLSLNRCSGQQSIMVERINAMKAISHMPYEAELSGDSLFWNLVKERKQIIPYLIEQLDDTTCTNAFVPNFAGRYVVGDIAQAAIAEIVWDFNAARIISDDSTIIDTKGFGVYWEFVRESFENRQVFKEKVRNWYRKIKPKLQWVSDDNLYAVCDCDKPLVKHPAGGHYVIRTAKLD